MNYSSTAPSTPKEQTSVVPFLSNPAYQNCPPVTEADILEADRRMAALDAQFQADQAAAAEMRALREETLDQLARYEISLSSALPDPKPVISREGATIGSEGNLSAIVGEAKSRKSFLCTAIVGDLLRMADEPHNGFGRRTVKTLWIDTEQSELHVRKVARRLTALSGWNDPTTVHPLLKLYALREEPPKERMQIVRSAIEAWQPRLVVIDGIADLQHNTNDLEESERIITELMALSTLHRCHILCVLHTNPNSDKARGHVGSGLQRKAETVLYVHRTGECSVVEPQFCRNEPFERFAFSIDNEGFELGLPVPATPPREREGEDQNIVVRLLQELYGGCIERTILTGKLMERLGVGRPAAGMRISRAIEQGKVLQSGKHVRLAHLPITADPAEADSEATTGTTRTAMGAMGATGVASTATGIAPAPATAPAPAAATAAAPWTAAMADDDDVPF